VTQRDRASTLWQLGDLLPTDGVLTRSVPIKLQKLPPVESVHIFERYLIWKMRKPDRVIEGIALYDWPITSGMVQPDPKDRARHQKDMLRSFAALHSATDQEILGYAKVWGRLNICEHNMPYQHGHLARYRIRMPPPLDLHLRRLLEKAGVRVRRPDEQLVPRICSRLKWEPLETWRFFSRQCRAILDIAASFQAGRPGRHADWRCIYPEVLPTRLSTGSVELNEIFLLEAIRGWTSLGKFELLLGGLDGKLSLSGSDLFAKLAVELALAVSRCKKVCLCSICGRQYEPHRKPALGRESYCGQPGCVREAARRRKLKSRQGKESH
jgi:hypothetical protein